MHTLLCSTLMLCLAAPWATPSVSLPEQDAEPAGPSEKDLREALDEGLKNAESAERVAAVFAFDGATRELPDQGTSRLVAKELADILADDEDLAVRTAAVRALAWGRHVDTVFDALPELLDDLRDDIEKLSTRPDEESRQRFRDTLALYAESAQVLASHPDDRAVDYLEGEMRTLQPGGSSTSVYSLRVFPPLADALLRLGTQRSVEAVVKQTGEFGGGEMRWENVRDAAEQVHGLLASFSESLGHAPPTFDDFYDQSWRAWFSEHEDELPAKLGKLKAPTPPPPAYEPPDRRPDRAAPGRAERP